MCSIGSIGTIVKAGDELPVNAGLDRVDAQLNGAAGAANTGPAVQVGGESIAVAAPYGAYGNGWGWGANALGYGWGANALGYGWGANAYGLGWGANAYGLGWGANAYGLGWGYGGCGIPTVSVPAVRYSNAVQTKTIPDHKLVQQQEQRININQVVEKYQVADTKEVLKTFKKTEFIPVIKYEAIDLEEEKTETTPVAKTLQRIRNVPTVSNHLRSTVQPSYKNVQIPIQVAHPTCVTRPACNPCGAYGYGAWGY